MTQTKRLALAAALLLAVPAVAYAQVDQDDIDELTSPEEPVPEPADPSTEGEVQADVVEQAGVGGPIPYGAQGTLEVGGAGLIWADDDALWAHLRPFAGWFFLDGLQLTYANDLVFTYGGEQEINTTVMATVELSVHIPLVERLWFAFGAGGGVLYNAVDFGGIGTARVGIDLLVGRSGMLHINAVGMLASEPLARPANPDVSSNQWRVGAEISYAVLF